MATVEQILNVDIPKPTFSLAPSLATPVPNDVEFLRADVDNPDPTARTFDPRTSKFESRPADTPRVHGSDQALLVERSQLTNYVQHSSDVSSWDSLNGGNGGVTATAATSVLKGETAHLVESGGGSGDHAINISAGNFSGGVESHYAILEEGTADKCGIELYNLSNNNQYTFVEYDFVSETAQQIGGDLNVDRVEARELPIEGPNGGSVVVLWYRVGGMAQGEPRKANFYPDLTGSGNGTYYHHTQIHKTHNYQTPIVTGGSAVTRGGDNFKITLGDFWNENQMTIIGEVEIMGYGSQASNVPILGKNGQTRYFGLRSADDYPNWQARFDDGTNTIAFSNGSIQPFTRHRFALSMTKSQMVASLDGRNAQSASHNGSLLRNNEIDTDVGESYWGMPVKWYQLDMIPENLSATELEVITA